MSALLLFPALFGFAVGEQELSGKLLLYSLLGGFISFSCLLSVNGKKSDLNRVNRVYLVVLSWLILPLALAIPLSSALSIDYLPAVFEAMSAFTTTAADSMANIEALPKTAIWLRALIQWLGGLATIVTFTLFLAPLNIGGLQSSISGAGSAANVYKSIWSVTRAYLFLSILCFAFLLMCRIQPFDASILTSTALSTGGYSPNSQTLLDVAGSAGMFTISLFLIIGATSVFWHKNIWNLNWKQVKASTDNIGVLVLVAVLAIIFFTVLYRISGVQGDNSLFQLMSESLFNATSLISTSGLESRPGIFALFSPLFVLALLFIGAASYSTAGGFKLFRIMKLYNRAVSELKFLIYPSAVIKSDNSTTRVGRTFLKSMWIVFCAALVTIGVGALALSVYGMSFSASLFAAISAFSNAGPSYSPEWVERGTQGWPTYTDMLIEQKMVLTTIMYLGRLEIIAVIAAFNPIYWKRR